MLSFARLALPALLATSWIPATEDGLADRVDALVTEAMRAPEAVGLSVAVAVGDEISFAKGYGLAEVEHGVPVDAETTFRIGSITKQFTAAAIVGLHERRQLDIDEEITAYLPDFPTHGHTVTIRHLLTHTSGIASYTSQPEFWRTTALPASHAEMIADWMDRPFDFEPGTAWAYDNSGYYLLGVILEGVTGQGWGDHLAERFFEPLGLTRTRVGSNDAIIENRAQGYRFVGGELANDGLIDMGKPGAAGALLSSASDLVRWQIALVSGQVVQPESYEEMTTPYMLSDATETSYGFGLALGELEGRRMIQHGGGIYGFNSFLLYLPEERLSVAVISNCEAFSSQDVASSITREVLGSLEARTEPASVK